MIEELEKELKASRKFCWLVAAGLPIQFVLIRSESAEAGTLFLVLLTGLLLNFVGLMSSIAPCDRLRLTIRILKGIEAKQIPLEQIK